RPQGVSRRSPYRPAVCRPVPYDLPSVPGARHRPGAGSYSHRPCRPLHHGRHSDRPPGPHQPARAVRRGRSGVHGSARREPPGQQLAPGRTSLCRPDRRRLEGLGCGGGGRAPGVPRAAGRPARSRPGQAVPGPHRGISRAGGTAAAGDVGSRGNHSQRRGPPPGFGRPGGDRARRAAGRLDAAQHGPDRKAHRPRGAGARREPRRALPGGFPRRARGVEREARDALNRLHPLLYQEIVDRALLEDVGHGDLTSEAIIPPHRLAKGKIVAKAPGRIAGVEVATYAFRRVDPGLELETLVQDGDAVQPGDEVLRLRGSARSMLTAERVALNFLQRLSGIATETAKAVEATRGTQAIIVDTRKTTPGLRVLEKYAVRVGGGRNHRFGLDDAVLIKENHIAVAGGIRSAVEAARAYLGHMHKIEVEVETLAQVEEAVAAGADAVLLDNMDLETMAEAVRLVGGRALVEASGGI